MIVTSILCAIGCAVADRLFPHIGPIEKFIQRLPLGEDERTARR